MYEHGIWQTVSNLTSVIYIDQNVGRLNGFRPKVVEPPFEGWHDTRNNDTQHNDIQHNGTQQNNIHHNDHQHLKALYVTRSISDIQQK